MAWLFKKTLLKGPTPMLIMECRPLPTAAVHIVLRHMWDRSKLFLRRAGTVILGINILLWFLATYPTSEAVTKAMRPGGRSPGASVRGERRGCSASSGGPPGAGPEQAGERLRHSSPGGSANSSKPTIRPIGLRLEDRLWVQSATS